MSKRVEVQVGLSIDWGKFFADMDAVGGDPIAAAASLPIGKYLSATFTPVDPTAALRCMKHIPAGYAPCTREHGHDGPCAHAFAFDPDVETRPAGRVEWEGK